MLFLSIVAAVVVLGHLYAIAVYRAIWPFDHYPMYSFPIKKMRYPIVVGDSLTMFSIVELLPGGGRQDLLSGARIYPPDFHPLDRLEVMLMLIKAGLLDKIHSEINERHSDHFRREVTRAPAAGAGDRVHEALADLLTHAASNRPALKAIAVVQMRWNDFRKESSDFRTPDSVSVIAEARRD
jgi:hypothetical protein